MCVVPNALDFSNTGSLALRSSLRHTLRLPNIRSSSVTGVCANSIHTFGCVCVFVYQIAVPN